MLRHRAGQRLTCWWQVVMRLPLGEVHCALWDVTEWSRAAQPPPRAFGESALPPSWRAEDAGDGSHDFWG